MVGRSTRTSAVRRSRLGTQHERLLQLIDDIEVAVRTKQLQRISELLKLLRATVELHIRQQHALLQEIRSRTGDLGNLGGRNSSSARFARLTLRERQVLNLVVKGHRNKEIAEVLGIGQRTVETYRAGVMKKIGARSLPELIRLVIVGSSADT
jgi:DNA-binding CsgD family transcriptional regulator